MCEESAVSAQSRKTLKDYSLNFLFGACMFFCGRVASLCLPPTLQRHACEVKSGVYIVNVSVQMSVSVRLPWNSWNKLQSSLFILIKKWKRLDGWMFLGFLLIETTKSQLIVFSSCIADIFWWTHIFTTGKYQIWFLFKSISTIFFGFKSNKWTQIIISGLNIYRNMSMA